jgi:hypothetical protein
VRTRRGARGRVDLRMAPVDRFQLPFRWEFVPVRYPRDGSIRWKWRAYSQTGDVAVSSEHTFESLTECMNDARKQGYAQRSDGNR